MNIKEVFEACLNKQRLGELPKLEDILELCCAMSDGWSTVAEMRAGTVDVAHYERLQVQHISTVTLTMGEEFTVLLIKDCYDPSSGDVGDMRFRLEYLTTGLVTDVKLIR